MPINDKRRNKLGVYGIFLLVLAVMAMGLASSPAYSQKKAKDAVAVGARLNGDVFRTRLIVDLTKKVRFRTFTLMNPYRLIIDIPNTTFRLPAGVGRQGMGVIKAFRYGQFAPGKSRIVVDLNQPVSVEKAYSLKPRQDQPGKLVIDLIPVDKETFLNEQEKERQKRLVEIAKKKKRRSLSEANNTLPGGLPFAPERPANKKPVIVIDPGHGGIDSGAVGVKGTLEKKIVLLFGKALREELNSHNAYSVKMTRSSDVFIPLQGRVRYARSRNADLFVSIHADSIKRKDPTVRGATVYTLSEKASDEDSRRFAQSENRSDVIAGVDPKEYTTEVNRILDDLARRETKNHSVAFAHMLISSIRNKTIVRQNPLRFANFVVLRAPDVPSVLVELGYMSSANDEKLLNSPEWRKKVAKSVAGAIERYFKKRKSPNPF